MPASPREPELAADPLASPPAGPSARLREYLADHDALCPYCKYNLRGLPTSQCPECASNLDLELVRDGSAKADDRWTNSVDYDHHADSAWWLLILVPIFLAALGVIVAFFFGWIR